MQVDENYVLLQPKFEMLTFKTTVMKHKFTSLFNLSLVLSGIILLVACKKGDNDHVNDHGTLTRSYSSDVLKEWIKLDLQLLQFIH